MTWLNSVFIPFLTGALGFLCGGAVMMICVDWYRISKFEGKSSYAELAVALLGGILGFIIGLIISRMLAGGADPSFLKSLGYASGTVVALSLLALAICRLGADLNPTMDGQSLELAVEIRCPKDFTIPTELDEFGATAGVYLPHGRQLPPGDLRLSEATQIDGHWVVPATVPLTTRVSTKYLNVYFNKDASFTFSLPLRSNPQKSDLEWSQWISSAWDVGQPEPAKEAKFNARFRVQVVVPKPPAPDFAEEETARFAALDPDAPLEQWLEFFNSSASGERNSAVADHAAQHQKELATLILSGDEAVREKALLVIQYVSSPTPELGDAVLAEGRAIADAIRQSNALAADDSTLAQTITDLSNRFYYWNRTWWVICQNLGLDGRPIYREILEHASVRPPGTAMDMFKLSVSNDLKALDK